MKKQTFNLHTHTARCGHAEGTDRQYIDSAIDAGLTLSVNTFPIPRCICPTVECYMIKKKNTLPRSAD